MSKKYSTEQENFWAGAFGAEYINRNQDKTLLGNKISFFSKVLSRTEKLNSVLEFGSNIGLNLVAIKLLLPNIKTAAVEINPVAVKQLTKNGVDEIFHESILEFEAKSSYDLTFTAGVLIHINPEMLDKVYERLYKYSNKYILLAEYYNPAPTEVNYRGHSERLFKRDFAGELMDKYPDLKLIDYGFVYHRDNNFPMDDFNWFLLQK